MMPSLWPNLWPSRVCRKWNAAAEAAAATAATMVEEEVAMGEVEAVAARTKAPSPRKGMFIVKADLVYQ